MTVDKHRRSFQRATSASQTLKWDGGLGDDGGGLWRRCGWETPPEPRPEGEGASRQGEHSRQRTSGFQASAVGVA